MSREPQRRHAYGGRDGDAHRNPDWDAGERTLTLSVRRGEEASTMLLAWLSPLEWRRLLERTGFEVEEQYGWFDRRPYTDEEDVVFVAGRRS